jgi:hypothetical protein
MRASQMGKIVFSIMIGLLLGACGNGSVRRVPTPSEIVQPQTLPPTQLVPTQPQPTTQLPTTIPSPVVPSITPSQEAIPTAPALLVTPTITSTASCPLGVGLVPDTISLNLAYPGKGRMVVAKDVSLAAKYFPQIQGGYRILVGPSLDSLQQLATQAQQVDLPYEALGYDIENWQQTPAQEKNDPIAATQKAAELAHKYGKLLQMAPPGVAKGQEVLYPKIAAYADLWMIQSQRLQIDNPPGEVYQKWVQDTVNLIRSGNPKIIIWVQISLTPGQRTKILSADDFLAYRQTIVNLVEGVFIFDRLDPGHPRTTQIIFADICGKPVR